MVSTGVMWRSQEGTRPRSQVERTAETMEMGVGRCVDLVGRRVLHYDGFRFSLRHRSERRWSQVQGGEGPGCRNKV